jgi:hypothetical protein
MAIQVSDAFLVARSGTNYQTPATDIMAIEDTDLLLVNRGGANYQVTGSEVKNYVNSGVVIYSPGGGLAPSPDFLAGATQWNVPGITHVSSTWQIALASDPTFSNPVKQVVNSTTDLNTWFVSGLKLADDFLIRVTYNLSDSTSATSPVVAFNFKGSPGDFIYVPPTGAEVILDLEGAIVTTKLWGAGGNPATGDSSGIAGGGGYATGTFVGTNGMKIRVGTAGGVVYGGYPGGGDAIYYADTGAGGGYSGIFRADDTPVIIAGGGGGAGRNTSTGAAGGGEFGGAEGILGYIPASQSAGGQWTDFWADPGFPGTYLQGGDTRINYVLNNRGGGGGGGYYGGGGSGNSEAQSYGGGGGGSGYIGGVTGGSMENGLYSDPGNKDDPDRTLHSPNTGEGGHDGIILLNLS